MPTQRDATLDVLRGLAVFTMIPANLSALLYAEPHDFWFRVAGSFAAPLFILLAGYMVGVNAVSRARNLRYYLVRGALVLAMAALIDGLIWRIYPFHTCDVLYLIGLALPLTYLFRLIPSVPLRWAIVAVVILAAPLLQHQFGYADYPTERYWLADEQIDLPANATGVLQHYLIDGWFPLFPWLAFAFLGTLLAERRSALPQLRLGYSALGLGLAIGALGLAIWWYQPGAQLVRGGYSELFYPATTGFVLTSIGLILLLFFLVDLRPGLRAYQPLRLLGEAALLMYLLHQLANQYLLSTFWPEGPLSQFLLVSCTTTVVLMAVGIGIRHIKERWPTRSMLVRFLLGG